MESPYEILGVSSSATDEEINKAYRKLARKYHPDVNQNSKEAEEMMKKINKAYDDIKRIREGKNEDNNYSYNNGYYNYRYSYDSSSDNIYQTIAIYIRIGLYRQAWSVLSTIQNRDDKWYYFSAVILFETGNKDSAITYMNKAIELNPNNEEYRKSLEYIMNNERSERVVQIKMPFWMRLIGWFIFIEIIIGFVSCFTGK